MKHTSTRYPRPGNDSRDAWFSGPRILCGLMSGTSLDGIDVALCRFAVGENGRHTLELLAHTSLPMPEKLGRQLSTIIHSDALDIGLVSRTHTALSLCYADAIRKVCAVSGIGPDRIDAVGMHGQTVFHEAMPGPNEQDIPPNTLQIGSGPGLARLLDVTVVSDFRAADVALGGQGAPLVPVFDNEFLRMDDTDCIALNIGGIANITLLEKAGTADNVRAFDTGPGNILIDCACRKFFGKRYDAGGSMAAAGRCIPRLLEALQQETYIYAEPPKSTGRELFNTDYLEGMLQYTYQERQPAEDVIRTLTEFSAWSIAENIRRFGKPGSTLIVSGGGVHNACLMQCLAEQLPEARICRSDDVGIPSDAKEAMAFAYLAYRSLGGLPGNMPSVTGARNYTVLGSVSF